MIKSLIKDILFHSKIFQKKRYERLFNINKDTKLIYYNSNKTKQIIKMMEKTIIHIQPNNRFQHWIDENIKLVDKFTLIGNMPPNYQKIIEYSLNDLIKKETDNNTKDLLNAILKYVDRIIKELKKYPDNYSKQSIKYFESMKNHKATNLEDALQRILFWSSLFWQSGHKLVGLGRLDLLLNEYENDYSFDETVVIIKDFLKELHNYYEFKSAELLGDIGQIIILGGLNKDGTYFTNQLTFAFIEAVKQCQFSDPKLLLRVSSNTPKKLIQTAIECVSTGVGSPLFSNDDVVVPRLIEFGYSDIDAYNYVTSACWEPVSYGNSLEQNNLANINFSKAFSDVLSDKSMLQISDFSQFLKLYKEKLYHNIQSCLTLISSFIWEEDPLFSYFTYYCQESHVDISKGGAKYNDYGILSVGMSNAINSLLNVKKYVFEEKKVSLEELYNINLGKQNIKNINLDLSNDYFGHDDETTIKLTNQVLSYVTNILTNYRNPLGGKVKFGLSSPGYVSEGENTGITFDNRKEGMPLGVHISANDSVAYSELVSFASQLNYTGYGSNGNVVDYFISPSFIQNNLEKFTHFIMLSIKKGFFQMQMNVVSSNTLIEAKKNPEQFPNLIVRVWGFSAYFKDLPVEYQDVLIKRAKLSEGIA